VPGARTAAKFVLLPVSIIFSNIVFLRLFGFVRYGFLGFLFWADLLLLIASYVLLLPPALQWLRVTPFRVGNMPDFHPGRANRRQRRSSEIPPSIGAWSDGRQA